MKLNFEQLRFAFYKGVICFFIAFYAIPYKVVDKELEPYILPFKIKLQRSCDSKQVRYTWQMSIRLVDKIPFAESEVIGQCQKRPLGFDISLKRDYWESARETDKQSVVYHEL